MRWAKVTSRSQADRATGHNRRTDLVTNADGQAPHPNVEFVATAGRGYWELAEGRIAEVVTRKVRADQVRCMEVILTASPEFFARDANGRAVDMGKSQWAHDQLNFLKTTFGEKNVVSCTLHQDEKSPHFHAVVVPITEDGRLSAKDLFNPVTLTGYQSQYAEAMKTHGLERGVEHSQAKHQPMQRFYGQQQETIGVVGPPLGQVMPYQDIQIKPPSVREIMQLDKWANNVNDRVNTLGRAQHEIACQAAARSARAALEAQKLAQESAAAKGQVKVLQQQLRTSEGLKSAAQEKVTRFEQEKAQLAMRLAQGKPVPEAVLQLGTRLREEERLDTKKAFEVHLIKGGYANSKEYYKGLTEQGFRFRKATEENPNQVWHPKHGSQFTHAEVRPNDRAINEQVEEQLQARRGVREQADLRAQQAEARQVEEARRQVATRELALMDRALHIYQWRVGPEDLTACLIVPVAKAAGVAERLQVAGVSWAARLGVQDEPTRTDGQAAVYVKYQADFAHQASQYFDSVRNGGSHVYEHAAHQARREQLQAQPQRKVQEREQEPTRSKGVGIGE